jgi:hypothetical protein
VIKDSLALMVVLVLSARPASSRIHWGKASVQHAHRTRHRPKSALASQTAHVKSISLARMVVNAYLVVKVSSITLVEMPRVQNVEQMQ